MNITLRNVTVVLLQVLLAHGADVGARTVDLWTPLHSASKWNNLQCALQLLQYGADVNATTNGGKKIFLHIQHL